MPFQKSPWPREKNPIIVRTHKRISLKSFKSLLDEADLDYEKIWRWPEFAMSYLPPKDWGKARIILEQWNDDNFMDDKKKHTRILDNIKDCFNNKNFYQLESVKPMIDASNYKKYIPRWKVKPYEADGVHSKGVN